MKDFNLFEIYVLGQGIEVSSKDAPFQCMDLAYLWALYNGVPKVAIQHGTAKEVFKTPNVVTRHYFEIIKNTPTFVPREGDLGIFDGTSNNPSGHIVVHTKKADTNKFESLDQNWGGKKFVTLVTHNYKNYLGVLRLKNV